VRLFHRVCPDASRICMPNAASAEVEPASTWKLRRYQSAVFGQYGISGPTLCQQTNDRKLALR
jgi:hypothetical protein